MNLNKLPNWLSGMEVVDVEPSLYPLTVAVLGLMAYGLFLQPGLFSQASVIKL